MENAEPLGALKELENLGLIEQIKYTNDKAELTLTPMGGRMIPYHLIQTTHISVNEVKLFLYETKYVYKR
jgi:DNA-binding HxlR family transcriptional regulator